MAAAQIVSAFQSIVGREVSPVDAAVVSVGRIQGGDAFNVIPAEVEMTGTIRSNNPEVRELILERVRQIVEGVAEVNGAKAELEIVIMTPALINDPEVTAVVREAAETVLGAENVGSGERTMGSEDAAYFMETVPGCYFFLGSSNAERGFDKPHHNPRFDIDEDALPLGVAVLAQAAAHYLL